MYKVLPSSADAYVDSSDVSLAGYICTHVFLIYAFAQRLQSGYISSVSIIFDCSMLFYYQSWMFYNHFIVILYNFLVVIY